MGSCGGCGARRAARAGTPESGKVTKYRITWGDGATAVHASYTEARLAMGRESDPVKRRGMRVTSFSEKP
jgi:hypothetical protein